jgi:hypothetical protein
LRKASEPLLGNGKTNDNGLDKEKEWVKDEEDTKILSRQWSEKINKFSDL